MSTEQTPDKYPAYTAHVREMARQTELARQQEPQTQNPAQQATPHTQNPASVEVPTSLIAASEKIVNRLYSIDTRLQGIQWMMFCGCVLFFVVLVRSCESFPVRIVESKARDTR